MPKFRYEPVRVKDLVKGQTYYVKETRATKKGDQEVHTSIGELLVREECSEASYAERFHGRKQIPNSKINEKYDIEFQYRPFESCVDADRLFYEKTISGGRRRTLKARKSRKQTRRHRK